MAALARTWASSARSGSPARSPSRSSNGRATWPRGSVRLEPSGWGTKVTLTALPSWPTRRREPRARAGAAAGATSRPGFVGAPVPPPRAGAAAARRCRRPAGGPGPAAGDRGRDGRGGAGERRSTARPGAPPPVSGGASTACREGPGSPRVLGAVLAAGEPRRAAARLRADRGPRRGRSAAGADPRALTATSWRCARLHVEDDVHALRPAAGRGAVHAQPDLGAPPPRRWRRRAERRRAGGQDQPVHADGLRRPALRAAIEASIGGYGRTGKTAQPAIRTVVRQGGRRSRSALRSP